MLDSWKWFLEFYCVEVMISYKVRYFSELFRDNARLYLRCKLGFVRDNVISWLNSYVMDRL